MRLSLCYVPALTGEGKFELIEMPQADAGNKAIANGMGGRSERQLRQPAQVQILFADAEHFGGALIESNDLKIDRRAGRITDRRQRDDALVGRAEDRVDQIVAIP